MRRRVPAAVCLVTLMSAAGSAHAVAQEVAFSGYGAVGYRTLERNPLLTADNEVYYEGKLQADITVSKHIDAQLDFRGNSRDNAVELREFSAKLRLDGLFTIKAGNTKKTFGLEQMLDQYELETVDRSYLNRAISELGYGDRAVSLTVYDKRSKKDSGGVPVSYYLSGFRDNSLNYGAVGRFSYHFSEALSASTSLQFQHAGAGAGLETYGVTGDISYEGKGFAGSLEGVMVQDPIEGLRRKMAGVDDVPSAAGAKLSASVSFPIESELLRSIEPVALLGWYAPDLEHPDAHTLQALLGVNVYIHKRARLRLNIDRLNTKYRFNDRYDPYDSRFTVEFQIRF